MPPRSSRPWLVTGGAGYIGAHVVTRLHELGRPVVVLDDLSTGDPDRMPDGVPLIHGSLADPNAVTDAMRRARPEGVIHLAAKKSPTESMLNPIWYAQQNVGGLIALLSAMREAEAHRLVFSSSCSVYGDAAGEAITEDTPFAPISPYGESKAYGEQLLRAIAGTGAFRVIALRYFNVVGAGSAALRDTSVVNLVPNVLRAAKARNPVEVFGTDYPTPDGSCVRDYIDVRDLADAHVIAAESSDAGAPYRAYNVGTGVGISVKEVVAAASEVVGAPIALTERDRRAGDPPSIVASVLRAKEELGWSARRSLRDSIESAWEAEPAPVANA